MAAAMASDAVQQQLQQRLTAERAALEQQVRVALGPPWQRIHPTATPAHTTGKLGTMPVQHFSVVHA